MAARAKNKAGRVPCFEIFLVLPVAPGHFCFTEWLRLIAPPVFPPSDLDHTRRRTPMSRLLTAKFASVGVVLNKI
jgi:hypothetical protein